MTCNLTKRSAVPLLLLFAAIPAFAQQVDFPVSWLDRLIENWELSRKGISALPSPVTYVEMSEMASRCSGQVRQADNEAERAVERKGWKLFGPAQRYGPTEIFMALSGYDGMCRPMGFQAFVYSDGRFAGTLSPVPMDSRTDSSISSIHLIDSGCVTAEFRRYTASAPLCCPSGSSSVEYVIRKDEIPSLNASRVTTSANGSD